MTRGFLKKAVILLLLTAMLLLMCPTPSFAGTGDTILILLGLAFIVLLIINAGDNGLFQNMLFDVYGLDTGNLPGFGPDSPAFFGKDIFYDFSWVFTGREKEKVWAGTGMTMKFSPVYSDYFNELTYGGNLVLGYNDDDWDYMMRFIEFTDGETVAQIEANYRF